MNTLRDIIIRDAMVFLEYTYRDLRMVPLSEIPTPEWVPDEDPTLPGVITQYNYDHADAPITHIPMASPGLENLYKAISACRLHERLYPDRPYIKPSIDEVALKDIIFLMLNTYKVYKTYRVYTVFDIVVVTDLSDKFVMFFKTDETKKLKWFQKEDLSTWMLDDHAFMTVQLDKFSRLKSVIDPIEKVKLCIKYDISIFIKFMQSPMISKNYICEYLNMIVRINDIEGENLLQLIHTDKYDELVKLIDEVLYDTNKPKPTPTHLS